MSCSFATSAGARRLAVMTAALAILACGRDESGTAGSESNRAAPPPSAGPRREVPWVTPVERLTTDPCGWVPAAEAERLLGPFTAPITRVRSSETPEPDPLGTACLYDRTRPDDGLRRIVVLEVSPDGPGTSEAVGGLLPGELREMLDSTEGVNDSAAAARWDHVKVSPFFISARQGRVSFSLVAGATEAGPALELAGLVIDRMPAGPFELERGDAGAHGGGNDPCALLTRAEAEAVLGELVAPPYRAREGTAYAHGDGPSCAYYGPRHRALIITPSWSEGQIAFKAATAMRQQVSRVTGSGAHADTLDGPWDQTGTSLDGRLLLLKGDKLLEVEYTTAGTDLAGALQLARAAVERL